MKAYTGAEMRSADKYTIEKLGVPGTELMDRAASVLFNSLSEYFGSNKRFVILCGKGNNGGDGWAVALKLWDIHENAVCISVNGEPVTEDAFYFYEKCRSIYGDKIIYADTNISKAIEKIQDADIVVEAVFGTGFSGEIEKDSNIAILFRTANKTECKRIAVDIPGGADASTGRVSEVFFKADRTVSFAKPKIGMYSYGAREICGDITACDIGIPENAFPNTDIDYEISEPELIRKLLPQRTKNSNKGSYGRLLCVVGSENMPGAASLAISGALRFGAGLVCVASEKSVLDILKTRHAEPIYLPVDSTNKATEELIKYSEKCTAILIGCGLGQDKAVQERVRELIRRCNCPIILDADGINAICSDINILKEAKNGILLTPHPLELSRLSSVLPESINKNRLEFAREFSKEYGCTLLLKGAGTIISDKGRAVCVNTTGCSALAKGGSGDVLAGIIASFAAQGASLYSSAVIGAYIHGLAGESLSEELSEYGVLPSELSERAARLLSDIISRKK